MMQQYDFSQPVHYEHCNIGKYALNRGPLKQVEATMQSIADRVLDAVSQHPGITDADLSVITHGRRKPQLVNGECNYLANKGKIVRRIRDDSLIGNYVPDYLERTTPKRAGFSIVRTENLG
jgi:hypothetical protein